MVVCPGFMADDGMYQRLLAEGLKANRLLGETTTEIVTDRVLDAVLNDRPEVIESSRYRSLRPNGISAEAY